MTSNGNSPELNNPGNDQREARDDLPVAKTRGVKSEYDRKKEAWITQYHRSFDPEVKVKVRVAKSGENEWVSGMVEKFDICEHGYIHQVYKVLNDGSHQLLQKEDGGLWFLEGTDPSEIEEEDPDNR